MVFCRMIVVLISKPIRKITLIMDFSVPYCKIKQFYCPCLCKVTHSAIKTFNLKYVESGNGILQIICSDNVKANSKYNCAATFNRFFFVDL